MARRIIAIGDIHGCSVALRTLLEAVDPRPEDLLIPLGDFVDRGPDSRGVIERLLELSDQCEVAPILGNHEEMMLEVLDRKTQPQAWLQFGGIATLDSYGFSGDLKVIPEAHVQFFRSCRDYVETEGHFFVHGNYLPERPLDKQTAERLRWTSLNDVIPPPHQSGKRAVVGHTADKTGEIFALKHLICIDTYCYGGQWLTAMDVTTGKVWQTNNEGQLRA